jgi:hypothetical protein
MTLIPEMFDGEEGGGSLQDENLCPHQGQAVSLRLPAHVGMLSQKENSTGLNYRPHRKVERQVKVLIKNLAIFFLFPSKQFLPILLKIQLLQYKHTYSTRYSALTNRPIDSRPS